MAAKKAGIIGAVFPARRARLLEEEMQRQRVSTISGIDVGVDELVASTADPVEAAAFNDQFKSMKSMAMSADPALQKEGLNGLSTLGTAVRQAVENRKQQQSGRVLDAAKDMRDQAQKALAPMRELQANTEQLNALLADPQFDQNQALNRGQLITLLHSTTRQMLSDPEDFADALGAAGGSGLIGSLVALASGTLAAKDFDFTKDDYRRIADAAYTYQLKKYKTTVAPLERDAAMLEKAAAGLDMFPPGYSLSNYILSDPEEFEKPLMPKYDEPTDSSAPSLSKATRGASTLLGNLTNAGAPDRAAAPANDAELPPGELPERARGFFASLLGPIMGDGATRGRELNFQIKRHRDAGASLKVDPKTGRTFAIYGDGRREEIETGLADRRAILGRIKQ